MGCSDHSAGAVIDEGRAQRPLIQGMSLMGGIPDDIGRCLRMLVGEVYTQRPFYPRTCDWWEALDDGGCSRDADWLEPMHSYRWTRYGRRCWYSYGYPKGVVGEGVSGDRYPRAVIGRGVLHADTAIVRW